MRGSLTITACLLALCATVSAQSDVTGRWRSDPPSTNGQDVIFDLTVEGDRVTGTVGQGILDVPVMTAAIYDGRREADAVTFKARSPDGDRSVTFTGTVQGDQIAFTRVVDVRPGGSRGGLGIFGVGGPPRFTVTRVKETVR